jgi:hypothetical protein
LTDEIFSIPEAKVWWCMGGGEERGSARLQIPASDVYEVTYAGIILSTTGHSFSCKEYKLEVHADVKRNIRASLVQATWTPELVIDRAHVGDEGIQ